MQNTLCKEKIEMKIYLMAEDEFPVLLDTENKTIQFVDSHEEKRILRENTEKITHHILRFNRTDVFCIASAYKNTGYKWVVTV
jgi:hypothetical protein